jgi:DNA-binding MarR family transcriptional regulator
MEEPLAAQQAEGVAALLLALMRQVFRPDDGLAAALPVGQLRVCGLLYDAPRPVSALSRELGVSVSAMTQIADRLEKAGLVKRVANGIDRRVRSLQLTACGQRSMQLLEKSRVRRVAAVLEQVAPEARPAVTAALETLVHACAASRQHDKAVEADRRRTDSPAHPTRMRQRRKPNDIPNSPDLTVKPGRLFP